MGKKPEPVLESGRVCLLYSFAYCKDAWCHNKRCGSVQGRKEV